MYNFSTICWLFLAFIFANYQACNKKASVPTNITGLSEPGVGGSPDQLSQSGGTDYAHHISTCSYGFSELPTALSIVRTNFYISNKVKETESSVIEDTFLW